MGAGKSTVGRLIADATGRELVDVDVAITTWTGKTVRELWEEGGEVAYRSLESGEVLDARVAMMSRSPRPEASSRTPRSGRHWRRQSRLVADESEHVGDAGARR